jgi:molecular chaperone DnaJ
MTADRDASERDGDDLYAALGIPPGATADEVINAYRRLARQRHPDANPDAGGGSFTDLSDAYEILRDPDRRRAYDRTRHMRGSAADAAAGVRIPVHRVVPPIPGRDDRAATSDRSSSLGDVEVTLTFDQAALGTEVVVPVDFDGPCASCHGTGRDPGSPTRCGECDGAGATFRTSGGIKIRTACARCDGSGALPLEACGECGGARRRRGTRDVVVRVPAGVDDDARLRIPIPGADAHLVAVVRTIPHPYFRRRGNDVTLRVPVTFAEATLGAVVSVPTLTGAVAIRIPAGTPSGRMLRVRGRGIPHAGGAGDLLVTVEVVVPAELNDAQRAALEAFAAATTLSPRSHFENPASS